jgi:transcriptional regulator with XRE-family HTH domain
MQFGNTRMAKSLDLLVSNLNTILGRLERKPAWLAQKSGIKPPNLGRLLKNEGDQNPTLETVDKLADALKIRAADLIGTDLEHSDANSIASPIPPEIWAAWKDSAPEIKALCYYMFLERYEFVDALPEKKKVKVLAAVRALGLNLPVEMS